jgi:hypothetical protein
VTMEPIWSRRMLSPEVPRESMSIEVMGSIKVVGAQ